MNLSKLGIKIIKVYGNVKIKNLITLEGCPEEIWNGYLLISSPNLISLTGISKFVEGDVTIIISNELQNAYGDKGYFAKNIKKLIRKNCDIRGELMISWRINDL